MHCHYHYYSNKTNSDLLILQQNNCQFQDFGIKSVKLQDAVAC